jgi:hypothetical protein
MHRQQNQEGYVMVTVAVVLVVFLGFTALSVDVGMLYSARASAQRAADASALAGAFAFVTHPNLSSTTTPTLTDMIKQKAVTAAATHKIFGDTVTITPSDVTVDIPNRRVTVQVNRTQGFFFGRAIGETTANITATAVAEAAASATGDGCTKPWFIPNTALAPSSGPNTEEICDTVQGQTPVPGACSSGHVLIDTTTHQPTTWGLSKIGTSFTIKPKNPNQALAPGQFYAIRLGDSNGGNDYATNIATCPAEAIVCSNSYTSENGNMVGPTAHGTCGLVCYDYDSSGSCNSCQKDTYVAIGQYRRPNGTISSTSRALRVAPIIDVCQFCATGGPPSGQTTFTVIGFALIFIDGIVSGNDVQAHLIDVIECPSTGGGGGGINPSEMGPFGTPVRLVRTS